MTLIIQHHVQRSYHVSSGAQALTGIQIPWCRNIILNLLACRAFLTYDPSRTLLSKFPFHIKLYPRSTKTDL